MTTESKCEGIMNYMRNEFRWGVTDVVRALASANGPNNIR
jgi:hypothetical protein